MVILWGVARVQDHADRNRDWATVQQCWWLRPGGQGAAAHALVTRTTPVPELDLTRLRFGPAAAEADRAPAAPDYDPIGGLDNNGAHDDRTDEARTELIVCLAADIFAGGGQRIGMPANMDLYERGGSYMHASAAGRKG